MSQRVVGAAEVDGPGHWPPPRRGLAIAHAGFVAVGDGGVGRRHLQVAAVEGERGTPDARRAPESRDRVSAFPQRALTWVALTVLPVRPEGESAVGDEARTDSVRAAGALATLPDARFPPALGADPGVMAGPSAAGAAGGIELTAVAAAARRYGRRGRVPRHQEHAAGGCQRGAQHHRHRRRHQAMARPRRHAGQRDPGRGRVMEDARGACTRFFIQAPKQRGRSRGPHVAVSAIVPLAAATSTNAACSSAPVRAVTEATPREAAPATAARPADRCRPIACRPVTPRAAVASEPS